MASANDTPSAAPLTPPGRDREPVQRVSRALLGRLRRRPRLPAVTNALGAARLRDQRAGADTDVRWS